MIPPAAQKYFWEVNPQSLNTRKHERLIVSRLLNYGRLDDWRWLIQTYGRNRVFTMLQSDSRLGVRESVSRLANIFFS
jgi:hypothetical protein